MLFSDHVAEVNADAEPDPPLLGRFSIAVGHAALNLNRTADGINDAWELSEQAVAGVLYRMAPVLGDLRLDQLPEMPLQPFVCPLLIRPHQARVARHVGGEDRGKAADRRHVSRSGLLA